MRLELFTLGGIARLPECNFTRQGIYWKHDHGTLPKEDGTVDGKPAWKRATLERAEILRPSPFPPEPPEQA